MLPTIANRDRIMFLRLPTARAVLTPAIYGVGVIIVVIANGGA